MPWNPNNQPFDSNKPEINGYFTLPRSHHEIVFNIIPRIPLSQAYDFLVLVEWAIHFQKIYKIESMFKQVLLITYKKTNKTW